MKHSYWSSVFALMGAMVLGLSSQAPASSNTNAWKTFRYELYGFEFKLPADWEPIEVNESASTGNRSFIYAPKSAEYLTRPGHLHLHVDVMENPKHLSYVMLAGLTDRPDLAKMYESDAAKITIDGKAATLVYDQPEVKEGPIVTVDLLERFLILLSPKEGLFSDSTSFKMFLSTFKFFKPMPGSARISTPAKHEKMNELDWCIKAPIPGNCLAELARTKESPNPAWCDAITLSNSQNVEGMYYYYKDSCYEYAAHKLNNMSLCDKMEGNGQFRVNKAYYEQQCRGWVNYDLALQKNDISYCVKIDTAVHVSNGYGTSVSRMDCFFSVATRTANIHLCDQLEPKGRTIGGPVGYCYYRYAIAKKDCSVLPPGSVPQKSMCESEVKKLTSPY